LRIVCLTGETADLCARLGAWDDVVAVSAYAAQSGLAAKPVASGFSSGGAEFILKFEPDLVLGFSDVQADLAASLIRAGANVLVTNQRTLAETSAAMRMIAGAVGRGAKGEEVVAEFERELDALRNTDGRKWRVYFEEWPEPPISGIGWVGEIIERCGGIDVFANRRGRSAKERMVTNAEIIAAQPEIILASWCGKPVDHAALTKRFATTPAGVTGRIHEIPGDEILQPGLRLIRGARRLREIFRKAS
jgi:iron complex transport system substrate-binding protein